MPYFEHFWYPTFYQEIATGLTALAMTVVVVAQLRRFKQHGKLKFATFGIIYGEHMKLIFLKLIRFYQKHISPCFPARCRYYPTCSAYAIEAIEKYGALKGFWLALKRFLRCHPFSKHDPFDPVP